MFPGKVQQKDPPSISRRIISSFQFRRGKSKENGLFAEKGEGFPPGKKSFLEGEMFPRNRRQDFYGRNQKRRTSLLIRGGSLRSTSLSGGRKRGELLTREKEKR